MKTLDSSKPDSKEDGLANAYFSLRGMIELAACVCVLTALLKLAGWFTLHWMAVVVIGPAAVILFACLLVGGLTVEVLGKDWIAGRQ